MPGAARLSNRPGVRTGMTSWGRGPDLFERLFSQLSDALLLLDAKGIIQEVNPAALQIFGFESSQDMIGRDFALDLWVHPRDRIYFQEILAEQGVAKEHPARLRRGDGTEFEAMVTCSQGQTSPFFALVRNVTQTRNAQRALMASEERYRRLIDHSPDVVFRWNIPAERLEFVNQAMTRIIGYLPAEVMANPGLMVKSVHPGHRERVLKAWREMVRGRAGDPVCRWTSKRITAKGKSVGWRCGPIWSGTIPASPWCWRA